MIELEIQTLSERREGLLIEVGRSVTTSGFVLQRQRLTQDANGVLMTLVVRGPSRKQRALEAALETHERLISFEVSPFEEGENKPHFAASRPVARPAIKAAPAPAPAPSTSGIEAAATLPVAAAEKPEAVAPPAPVASVEPEGPVTPETAETEQPAEPEFEFILPTPTAAPAPSTVEVAPFVEIEPLEADEAAVDKALRDLESSYPQIMPSLIAMESAIPAGARESSLVLAGQRIGAWIGQRDHAQASGQDLHGAIESVAVPALQALVSIERDGDQLHILDSPLCNDEHSGCAFFNGFLEGVLGPALRSTALSIFPVCCRSYGADACVLALSD